MARVIKLPHPLPGQPERCRVLKFSCRDKFIEELFRLGVQLVRLRL